MTPTFSPVFTTAGEFIAACIPMLIGGRDRLQVHAVSYSGIRGYPDGRIETCENGLSVVIRTSRVEHSGPSMGRFIDQVLNDDIDKPVLSRLDGELAQQRVEAAMREVAVDRRDIAFVYAGLAGFEPAVDYAVRLAGLLEPGNVFLVTCSCQMDGKRAYVFRRPDAARLGALLVTEECGGKVTMRDIVNAVIAAWPARVRH